MKGAAKNRRERVRAMLADLKMPGALEVADDILAQADGGSVTAGEAIEKLHGAQIELRNNRRLQSAMRSSSSTSAATAIACAHTRSCCARDERTRPRREAARHDRFRLLPR